jgi:PAS domain-containing protein
VNSQAERTAKEKAVRESGAVGQAEPAAGRSDLAFRRMVEKLPAAAYTCDADGLITYFNRRAVELWGREPKLNDPVDRY